MKTYGNVVNGTTFEELKILFEILNLGSKKGVCAGLSITKAEKL